MSPRYKNTLGKILSGLNNCVTALLFVQCLRSRSLCEIPLPRSTSWNSGT